MDVMGYGQLLYGRTYDVTVYAAAGLIYLVVNGLLTLLMGEVSEKRALKVERRNQTDDEVRRKGQRAGARDMNAAKQTVNDSHCIKMQKLGCEEIDSPLA